MYSTHSGGRKGYVWVFSRKLIEGLFGPTEEGGGERDGYFSV